jgi:type IV fimbrial biogenesis protein FimT
MKKRVLQLVLTGDKYLNKFKLYLRKPIHLQNGFSLLELMAVVLIVVISVMTTMPLLQQQIAAREIETIARRFIAHAHFARQQALHLGQPVHIVPIFDDQWDMGWVVKSGCIGKSVAVACIDKAWLSQAGIDPIYFKGGGKQFIDPNSGKKGILFNAAGAAKTAQGGFVANRLILGHSKALGMERQMILGSGGRWRICDPASDAKRCH